MKTSHLALASLLIVGLLSVSLWNQRKTIRKLAAENSALQEKASLSEGAPAENSNNSASEKIHEQEHRELMRLRGEVALLRGQRPASGEGLAKTQSDSDSDTNSLQHLLKILSDNDPSQAADSRRYEAAQKLRGLGQEAVAGLPKFVDLLHSGNEQTSYAGARALAFISESSPEAFQNLANALSDPDAQVRDAASHGIGLLFNQQFKNVDADSLLPVVLRNLQDADRTVRMDSANTVNQYIEVQQRLGKTAQPELVVPALMQNLNDDYSYTRLNAVLGIAKYGDKAQAALPEISKLLNDPDAQVQRAAKTALQQITALPAAQP